MTGRPTKLTGAALAAIVREIRAGAFDWVAAEAAGIADSTFYSWLQRGDRDEEPYARFAAEVRRARAEARSGAEQRVLEQNPLAWLRLGPGRERRGKPGWTDAVAALDSAATENFDDPDGESLADLARAIEEVAWAEVTHPNAEHRCCSHDAPLDDGLNGRAPVPSGSHP